MLKKQLSEIHNGKSKPALAQVRYGRREELLTVPIIAGYCEIIMDNGMYADMMSELPGLPKEEFDKQYEMALLENVNGVQIRFVHDNHLIQNKKATGRPKDLSDIQELAKINGYSSLPPE